MVRLFCFPPFPSLILAPFPAFPQMGEGAILNLFPDASKSPQLGGFRGANKGGKSFLFIYDIPVIHKWNLFYKFIPGIKILLHVTQNH
jgi:hypothetical protein